MRPLLKGIIMKDKLQAIAEHLSTHKIKYGVATALATAGGVALYKITLEWMEFYDEYVAPEMDATK
jgi:hypothetical protein